MRKFNIYSRAVLLYLWGLSNHHKSDTFFCSDKKIAYDIGMHEDTVKRAKRHLAASGWIRYVSGKHEGKATVYTILTRHDGSKKYLPLWKAKSPADSTRLESPAPNRSININESIDIPLANARGDQNNTMHILASACAPAEHNKGLRSMQEIQREHPGAVKMFWAGSGGKCVAVWKDASREKGFAVERCL